MHDQTHVKPVIWSARINQIPKEVMVREDLYEHEHERSRIGPRCAEVHVINKLNRLS